jgi:uncharacterized protein
MSRIWLNRSLLLLSFFVGNFAYSQLLWKATPAKPGPEFYLFGTMHLGMPNYLQEFPKLKNFMDTCDCLITETSLETAGIEELVFQYAKLPQGIKLSDSLTEVEWYKMDSLLASFGNVFLSAEVVNSMKPIYVQLVLSSLQLTHGKTIETNQSVDQSIQEYCKLKGMTLKYFETQEQQMGFLFNDIPLSSQFNMLRSSLNSSLENKELEGLMERLPQLYKSQNLDSLQWLLNLTELNNAELDEIYLNLLDKRNSKWVQYLVNFNDTNSKRIFVAVGAAHLPGENGLIALMRQNGYMVEPIKFD